MNSLLLGWILAFATIAAVALVVFLSQYESSVSFQTIWCPGFDDHVSTSESIGNHTEITLGNGKYHNTAKSRAEIEELKILKFLYYQLHSLEKFPDVLPEAKMLLLSLLRETSTDAQIIPDHESIWSLQSFSRQNLEEFQRRRHNNIGRAWRQYNLRRDCGGMRELFRDREEAIWWLKQIAPVKYVDGAWLGHIGKVTTPFALWKTTKGAWQILSEELGDGDLAKNHVNLYHNLLETVAPGLPTAEVLDFGHPRHGLGTLSVWKSAIAQLLISIFPHEFLPEILGFNLHFEAVSMDTLKATKELKELGIDPYYFILHISIDNTDSGHSAIAIETVCEYMDYVNKVEGPEAAHKAWKRVQAGYLLSLSLPGTVVCPSMETLVDNTTILLSPTEVKIVAIFKAKAQVVDGIHCSSRVKIGSRSVADWLDPVALESREWQMGLLNALSCSKYWVCRGNSTKSRFLQELQWNGRMFGSFTQNEYDVLRGWIDSLPNMPLDLKYPHKLENIEDGSDNYGILSGYPVFQRSSTSMSMNPDSPRTLFSFQNLPCLEIGNRPVVERFLPLWLSHPCLLQTFVSVPFRTKNEFACTVVKILRAQGGFDIERECPAGMGEVRRLNSLGLSGIGMNMMMQHGLSLTKLPSLKHVLQAWPSEFAVHILHISMQPMAYKGFLVGMATAFAKLHFMLKRFQFPLLSALDQETLQNIAQRELEGLEVCWKILRPDKQVYIDCCKGYIVATEEIKKCFQS
jgi:hypothetical protein